MISVEGLTKRYGSNRGIKDINFSINEGEIVGFLGANGAGKTTTMNILTGYLSATEGSVKIADIDVLADPIAAKRHIGYLPELPPLYPDMTVREYLEFIYELKGVKAPGRDKLLRDICDMVSIGDVYGRLIRNLSKGYRQRVGLAQSLVGDPDVLILDEPTVGLDPKQIVDIRNLIKSLGSSRTIILSTHILPEVSAVCERVLLINEGEIIADDKPENLSQHVTDERKLVIRIAGQRDSVLQLLRAHDGIKSADALSEAEPEAYDYMIEAEKNIDPRRSLFSALARAGMPILRMVPQNASLEEVFIKLTQSGSGEGIQE